MPLVYHCSRMVLLHAPRYDSSKEMITPDDLLKANAQFLENQKHKKKPETLADIIRSIYEPCRKCKSETHSTTTCPYPWGWNPSMLEKRTVRQMLEGYKIVDPPKQASSPVEIDMSFHPVPKKMATQGTKEKNMSCATNNLQYSAGSFEPLSELKIGTSLSFAVRVFIMPI